MSHSFGSQETNFASSQVDSSLYKCKELYKAPKLKIHGKLERITLQNGAGSGPLGDGGDGGTTGLPTTPTLGP